MLNVCLVCLLSVLSCNDYVDTKQWTINKLYKRLKKAFSVRFCYFGHRLLDNLYGKVKYAYTYMYGISKCVAETCSLTSLKLTNTLQVKCEQCLVISPKTAHSPTVILI